MRTVKLVVIGASGVGKSSVRNQYISGRFTTGYRATIGADFITKTLSHHSHPDELVTLQIWDTAGQERFSSLSSAFFRGADAVILMFDVNQPQTLEALTKWWDDFRDKAPVPDEHMEEFCCVVVGNKIDMMNPDRAEEHSVVTQAQARAYVHTLVPQPTTPPRAKVDLAHLDNAYLDADSPDNTDNSHVQTSDSIDITSSRGHFSRQSRSSSRSTQFRGGTIGTMATIYHTPSSSLFDSFDAALSSPAVTALSVSRSASHSPLRPPRHMPSSSSSSSAPTITPSLFIRGQAMTSATTPASDSPPPNSYAPPPPPERYPKLFFTSAKTGDGVKDVFEYIARRVVTRREYEEALEARTMQMQEADQRNSIFLSGAPPERRRTVGLCCKT